jgi:hypothetical protein
MHTEDVQSLVRAKSLAHLTFGINLKYLKLKIIYFCLFLKCLDVWSRFLKEKVDFCYFKLLKYAI